MFRIKVGAVEIAVDTLAELDQVVSRYSGQQQVVPQYVKNEDLERFMDSMMKRYTSEHRVVPEYQLPSPVGVTMPVVPSQQQLPPTPPANGSAPTYIPCGRQEMPGGLCCPKPAGHPGPCMRPEDAEVYK